MIDGEIKMQIILDKEFTEQICVLDRLETYRKLHSRLKILTIEASQAIK